MRGGAHGHYFNPLSDLKGWGYESLGIGNLHGAPLSFVAYAGPQGGYAYVPKPDPALLPEGGGLPRGGVQAAISGVSVSLMGRDSILESLLASAKELEEMPGMLHLDPQEIGIIEHWEYFGGGALSSLTDEIYRDLGVPTGTLKGKVTGADGAAAPGALVTAINEAGQAMSQARTGADGLYEMIVPVGQYHLRARLDVRVSREDATAAVSADESAEANLELKDSATIHVTIQTPDGRPTPGRVSVFCVDVCPDMPTSLEADVTYDSLPEGFAKVVWAGVDGKADIEVAAGNYRVSVSRGMEWSVWPPTAPVDGGRLVEAAQGDAIELSAEIAHVVDTEGVLSGDFHVHGITSADSVVRSASRVLGYMGDGVDVLVSTDHDYIFDYAPTVAELDAGEQIATIVGVEITTPNIGHFNTFPMVLDPAHRRGGALDWAGGPEYDMTPAQLFDWMDNQDGKEDDPQVKQINHAAGTIPPLEADVLRGITFADAAGRRMEPTVPDPVTGDTGLWSDNFNAIEVMNGTSMPKFWTITRWWLTMISRGFSPTGTAVTDTHRLYSDLGASPRTFVFVGPDHDTVPTFDEDVFAAAVDAGRAVGSNGPFFRVELENTAGESAGLGETLESTDGAVVAHVTIDVPEWMHVDTIDIYSNLPAEQIVTAPGEINDEPVAPTSSHPINWEPTDLVEAATGDEVHKHWTKTVDIPLTIEEDAYVVVVVRGEGVEEGDVSMWPIMPKPSVKPFAFSNPIFVDADGGGYDNPPLEELAQTPIEPMMLKKAEPEPFSGEVRPADLGEMIEHFAH
jgi:hypothetical protein